MMKNIKEELKCLEGQPIRIYADDGRIYSGIDLEAGDSYVRIIDRCDRLFYVQYCHIDAIEQPQMELSKCRCNDGNDYDYGYDYDSDYDYGKDGNNSDCDCGCGCGRSRCC